TDLSQESPSTAVLEVLQLNGEAIGIGEVQLRRPPFGAAAVRHAQADIGDQRLAILVLLFLDSVVDQQLRDLCGIEVAHRHARVIDSGARWTTAASGASTAGPGRAPAWGRTAGARCACTRTTCASGTTGIAGEHQEVNAVAHAPRRGRCLIRLRLESKELLIERNRPRIVRGDGEMAHVG